MKYWVIGLLLLAASCKKEENNQPADPYIKISISDVSKQEGGVGTSTTYDFTVTLDKASNKEITLKLSTVEASATLDDFNAVNNVSMVIPAGTTSKSQSVTVVGDNSKEGNETFILRIISTTSGLISKADGVGTIVNDDLTIVVPTTGYDAPTTYPGYSLVWADEFNTGTLNAANWSFETGDGCPNVCGWGNNELEYYTNRPENLFFQDGKMIIEARPEAFGGKNYTSAKVVSRGKQVFKYGRIDVRAVLPKGKGVWPAIWMLPQAEVFGGWPRSGEIDIMELVGHQPNRVYGTLHYGPGPGSIQQNKSYQLPSGDFSQEFHVFSLEWKQDQIKWYVDGNLFGTTNKADIGSVNWPFNESFFFILNVAVGGNWPGNPDASTSFPQWMMVDYVRVYQ